MFYDFYIKIKSLSLEEDIEEIIQYCFPESYYELSVADFIEQVNRKCKNLNIKFKDSDEESINKIKTWYFKRRVFTEKQHK